MLGKGWMGFTVAKVLRLDSQQACTQAFQTTAFRAVADLAHSMSCQKPAVLS